MATHHSLYDTESQEFDGHSQITSLFTIIDRSPFPRYSVGICQMYQVDQRQKRISRSEGSHKKPGIQSFWEVN